MLKLTNVSKSYSIGEFYQDALDKVSLEFRQTEFVSVLGPSGCGKTTLLNVIGGLDRADDGDLIINGKSTKKFSDREWDMYRNNSIGFVFQNHNLISHLSVLHNVEMGLSLSGASAKDKKTRALEVLERVGLKDHIHKKPNQLSGGQQQRVAVARALANNPDIILADEPTGSLDTETGTQILDLIKEIAKEKLVIMVTHDSDMAYKYANRVIKLKDGSVIDDSNPVKKDLDETGTLNLKKTSMSYATAFVSSINNIKTKLGRTILTAFAGSIGIIGIALILSLSNGMDQEIDNFE
ncbi:MAG: ABC transporter ATP-binding protein, partial [Candidatus Izemoplasmatales bacterium]